MKSKWTKEEVMYAKNCGKKVIPVLLNGATLKGWFLFRFGRVDCIDLSKKEQVEKMIKNLSAWVDKNTDDDGLINNGEDKAGSLEDDEETSDFISSSHDSKITKPSLKKWSLVSFIVISLVGLIIGVVKYCDKEYVLEVDGTETGHDYVDLGLSVKWATCNVGASYPESYGDYFAWGETQPKSTYDWSTYKWCNGSHLSLTKYSTDSDYGTVDNKTQLELSDDAAHANWGGSWRMPTDDEWTELREQCTWTWITLYGVDGYKVTSKTNGRSIFLPAAGCLKDSYLSFARSYGHYWSSSLSTDYPASATYVLIIPSYAIRSHRYRFYGRSVRPVCP